MCGYALTIRPLLASGMAFRTATRLAFAADTLSITIMEIVDNLIVLAIPAAMAAGLTDPLFWGSLALGRWPSPASSPTRRIAGSSNVGEDTQCSTSTTARRSLEPDNRAFTRG